MVRLALCLLLALTLAACGDDDGPTAPDPAPGAVSVTARVNLITAYTSCEGDGGTGVGDFYSRLNIYQVVNTVVQPVSEVGPVLTPLERGETSRGVVAETSATFELVDGLQISVRMVWYENDPDGPQIQRTQYIDFTWDAATRCWTLPGEDPSCGVDATFGDLSIMQGGNCLAELTWEIEVVAVD